MIMDFKESCNTETRTEAGKAGVITNTIQRLTKCAVGLYASIHAQYQNAPPELTSGDFLRIAMSASVARVIIFPLKSFKRQ